MIWTCGWMLITRAGFRDGFLYGLIINPCFSQTWTFVRVSGSAIPNSVDFVFWFMTCFCRRVRTWSWRLGRGSCSRGWWAERRGLWRGRTCQSTWCSRWGSSGWMWEPPRWPGSRSRGWSWRSEWGVSVYWDPGLAGV